MFTWISYVKHNLVQHNMVPAVSFLLCSLQCSSTHNGNHIDVWSDGSHDKPHLHINNSWSYSVACEISMCEVNHLFNNLLWLWVWSSSQEDITSRVCLCHPVLCCVWFFNVSLQDSNGNLFNYRTKMNELKTHINLFTHKTRFCKPFHLTVFVNLSEKQKLFGVFSRIMIVKRTFSQA